MPMNKSYLSFKNIIDPFIAIILLIILSPLFVILAILIVIDSSGSPFFYHERIGKQFKPFKVIKLRTMVSNATSLGTGIFTNSEDPRITRVGKALRKYSLDELPQLINIAKGEMSFIGPRPPSLHHPYKINEYPKKFSARFLIKPGITGLAQINGRTNITWEKRFELDIKYLGQLSFQSDLDIIIKTIRSVIFKIDVYPHKDYIKNHHKK